MYKYEIIIYWANKDKIYIAEVPELPGCSAHGNTYDKALKKAQEAIELWIDTAKEFSDPIPEHDEQKCFSEIAKCKQLVQKESAGIKADIKVFKSALLAKAFRGEL